LNWSALAAAFFSLVGVALGTAGTLLSQYLTSRATVRQAQAERSALMRTERKEAIVRFLEIVQQVERFEENLYITGAGRDGPQAAELTHKLWLAQKYIDLICSAQLREPTLRFAGALNESMWNDPPKGQTLWDLLAPSRGDFLTAARQELEMEVSAS
jgi:hypothetical protein